MSEGELVHDLAFLCRVCVKQGVSVGQLAVMTSLFRLREAEAYELRHASGLSKSNLYRQLDYLESKDAVRVLWRKDRHRQRVKVWTLTESGKRTVREYERIYRLHCLQALHEVRVRYGKEAL